MANQFENPEETKAIDETVVNETKKETIDRLAEDLLHRAVVD